MPRIAGTELVAGRFYPVLSVTLRLPGGSPHPMLAIVDSGADRTSVPAEFLTGTPIDHATLPIIPGTNAGAGGIFEARLCDCEIWYEKWKVCDRFVVIEPGKMPMPIVLLGRDDFFRRFTVSFDWSKSPPVFDVKRNK